MGVWGVSGRRPRRDREVQTFQRLTRNREVREGTGKNDREVQTFQMLSATGKNREVSCTNLPGQCSQDASGSSVDSGSPALNIPPVRAMCWARLLAGPVVTISISPCASSIRITFAKSAL
jgi:hypothetical protein